MTKAASNKPTEMHHGWLQPTRRQRARQPIQSSVKTTPAAKREGPDFFIPVAEEQLTALVAKLRRDDNLATAITLTGSRTAASGVWLTRLCGREGWLMVGKHTLQSEDVITEHYVLSACCADVPTIHPEACLQLLSCPKSIGTPIPVPDDVQHRLENGLERLSPKAARERHRRRLDAVRDKISELTRRLEQLDEEIAETRRALRRFVRRTDEYFALDAQLTTLLQEDFRVVVQRRKLRAASPLGGTDLDILMHDVEETTRPLLILRWRLEP